MQWLSKVYTPSLPSFVHTLTNPLLKNNKKVLVKVNP